MVNALGFAGSRDAGRKTRPITNQSLRECHHHTTTPPPYRHHAYPYAQLAATPAPEAWMRST